LTALVDHVFGFFAGIFAAAPFKALGGIHIAAGSERIKVLDNDILGGAGNGILLGGSLPEPVILLAAGPGETQHIIEGTGEKIQGTVVQGGVGAAGIGLVFTNIDTGLVRNAVSGSGGFFSVRTPPGRFEVAVSTPGLEIESIEVTDNIEFGRFHRITVTKAQAAPPDDALAFLNEIQIDRNEISHMGLSGIGYPIVVTTIPAAPPSLTTAPVGVAAALLELFGNPVVTLGIHRNHIHDCLQNPFEGDLRAEANQRGFGGISLGFCEDVTISGNRIERNGTNHVNPACGIFIRFGEKVDIHHNHVFDNGPRTANAPLESGVRGGIVVNAASFGLDDLFAQRGSLENGRHAVRIHDNIVHQPAGQALRLLCIGSSSTGDNRFSTDLSGPAVVERLAGTLLVITLGGTGRFPAGTTLFNGNQSHLGPEATSFVSQIIFSTDDIGFDGNQSVALTDGIVLTDTISVFTNTFLSSRTLRATDSRFKETAGSHKLSFKFSLFTLTNLLNNTNDNQGDHCIIAVNQDVTRPANGAGNQIVDATLCPRLSNSIAVPVSHFKVGPVVFS
jgi:hypothetical protein